MRHRSAEFDPPVKDLGARLTDPSQANFLLKRENSRKVRVEGLKNFAEAVGNKTEPDGVGSATSAAAVAASTTGSTNNRVLLSSKDVVVA